MHLFAVRRRQVIKTIIDPRFCWSTKFFELFYITLSVKLKIVCRQTTFKFWHIFTDNITFLSGCIKTAAKKFIFTTLGGLGIPVFGADEAGRPGRSKARLAARWWICKTITRKKTIWHRHKMTSVRYINTLVTINWSHRTMMIALHRFQL